MPCGLPLSSRAPPAELNTFAIARLAAGWGRCANKDAWVQRAHAG